MGDKNIFEVKTEGGRAINTTAEHPYFVRGLEYIRNLNGVSTNNLPLNSEGLTLSNKSDNASVTVLMIGGTILMNTIPSCFSGGNKSMLPKCLSNDSIILPSVFAITDINSSLDPREAFFISNPLLDKNSITKFGMFSSARSFSLSNRNIFFLLEKFGGIVNSRQDSFFRELGEVVPEDFFRGYASAYQGKNLPYHNSGAFESELSMADFAVRDNVFVDFNSHNVDNNNLLYKTYDNSDNKSSTLSSSPISSLNLSGTSIFNSGILTSPAVNNEYDYLKLSDESLREWLEVRHLKEGMKIAVPDYETGSIKWEKIASRNFIANDIVAHNYRDPC